MAGLLIFAVPVQATGCGNEATAGAAGYYVADGQVWKESNSQPGLQRGPCIDGQGRDHPGDEMVAELPEPPAQPTPSDCYPSSGIRACYFWGPLQLAGVRLPNACVYGLLPNFAICLH